MHLDPRRADRTQQGRHWRAAGGRGQGRGQRPRHVAWGWGCTKAATVGWEAEKVPQWHGDKPPGGEGREYHKQARRPPKQRDTREGSHVQCVSQVRKQRYTWVWEGIPQRGNEGSGEYSIVSLYGLERDQPSAWGECARLG